VSTLNPPSKLTEPGDITLNAPSLICSGDGIWGRGRGLYTPVIPMLSAFLLGLGLKGSD